MKSTMTDERKGLPSASAIERLAACPGSWELSKQAPPQPESEDAARGTRIHGWLAAMITETPYAGPELAEDELETASQCLKQFTDIKSQYMPGSTRIVSEERYWLRDLDGEPIFSGKMDVVVLDHQHVLIVDFKTGWEAVQAVERNLQMRSYALLAWAEWKNVQEITVAIIQPHAQKPTLCRYNREHIPFIENEILKVISLIQQPNQTRIAGDHCKYCPAKTICEAYQSSLRAITPIVPASPAAQWTPEQWAYYADVRSRLRQWMNDRDKELVALAKAGKVPGYTTIPGKKRRKITDPVSAFAALEPIIGFSAVRESCDIKRTKLIDAYRCQTGCTKKEAEQRIDDALGSLIEITQDAEQVVHI